MTVVPTKSSVSVRVKGSRRGMVREEEHGGALGNGAVKGAMWSKRTCEREEGMRKIVEMVLRETGTGRARCDEKRGMLGIEMVRCSYPSIL